MTNPIGQTLLDQYRVDAFIASGGMGAVYRVSDLKRNVPLAMKVLHADLAEDPSVFKRFEREARALKKLAHPNIVPFYGLFKTSDFAFLLEQYVDGPTLKDVLRQRKALSVEEALIYLKALSAALGYAHAHGVVHCDVKPGNVMIDRGGSIYLTDFGVARHAESTTTTLGAAGTPAYMAPEQCRGEPVTAATDVYALGIVLYEMVTGTRPFQASGTGEKDGATAGEQIRYAHLHTAPPHPCQANPAIPRALGDMILKALEKDPPVRYPTTWALFEAACAAVGTHPHAVPDRATLPSAIPETATLQMRGAAAERYMPSLAPLQEFPLHPPAPAWRQRGVLMVGALVLLVMAGIAVIALSRGGVPTPTPRLLGPNVVATSAAVVSSVPPTIASSPSSVVSLVPPTIAPSPTPTPIPATPTLAIESGRIVFATNRDGLSHLYLVNGDGSRLRKLTEGFFYDWEPKWSPDGQRILFVSNRPGPNTDGLYIMNADGSKINRLSPPGGKDDTPAWASGGKRILFSSNRSGNWDIYEMNQDGSGRVRLTNSPALDSYPVPSPDGSEIAFYSDRAGAEDLYVMSRDGTGVRRVTTMPEAKKRSLSWSPDGQWIAFHAKFSESDNRIYIIRPDGTGQSLLVQRGGYPGWLPDSRRLIFDSDRDGIGKIYVTDINGANLRQVTSGNGWDWSASFFVR